MTVEKGEVPASCTVRRVRAEEWQSIRVEMIDGVNHEMVRACANEATR